MLKQRLITAVVLASLLLWALFSEQKLYWQILINAAILIGFWEWLRFCAISHKGLQACAFIVFIGTSFILQNGFVAITLVATLACIGWLVLFVFTMTDILNVLHNRWVKLLIGIMLLATSGLLVIEFKNIDHGIYWVLGFMAAVFAADIGAYFVGRRFGKTKLAPSVSPGKTVEGFLGGLVFSVALATPLLFNYFSPQAAVLLLVAVVVTVVVSVLGDLFESKQKRYAGLKDSSQILPGHGGVLDRIDSLLSAAPFFAAALMLLGYWIR